MESSSLFLVEGESAMSRFCITVVVIVMLLAVVAPCRAADANPEEVKATTEVEKRGGKVKIDEKSPANGAAQIIALQKERVAALQELVKICIAQYQSGVMPLESVSTAQNELIDALLDSTAKPEERVTLLTEQLKIADMVVQAFDKRYKAGFGTMKTEFLRAKSHYLNVKIKLLRERGRLKPVTK
jgi:outer membrane protein TolC